MHVVVLYSDTETSRRKATCSLFGSIVFSINIMVDTISRNGCISYLSHSCPEDTLNYDQFCCCFIIIILEMWIVDNTIIID